MAWTLKQFVTESNRIEGIRREPTCDELRATSRFLALERPTTADLEALVAVYAPGHRLRSNEARGHVDAFMMNLIRGLFVDPLVPWQTHIAYRKLNPFTGGNGQSGRAIWLWQVRTAPYGFLHEFYMQTCLVA